MMASRTPKPRANVRTPADLDSRPTHMAPPRLGVRNRPAPTPTRAIASARAISRSSIAALLLHELVSKARRGRPQRGLGVDARPAGQRDHAEQQSADLFIRRSFNILVRADLDADRRRLALHLVGVEQRRQVAGDAVHDAGPALLLALDLLP